MNYKRSEPLEVEKISPDRVIGFCEAGSSSTKRKIWLALHNTSIICCDPPKSVNNMLVHVCRIVIVGISTHWGLAVSSIAERLSSFQI